MRKMFQISALVIVVMILISVALSAQQYPKSTGYVSDFADLLTREQGASLNEELISFEAKTTIEIAVVTVPWLNNQSIENYTQGLAQEWGVGKRGQDNGVVFLIAPKERQMRIQTASGSRTILTDTRADQIRDNQVLPSFKAGNMAQGIIDGAHAIMQALGGSPVPVASLGERTQTQPVTTREWTHENTKLLFIILGGIGFFVLIVLFILRIGAREYVLKNKASVAEQFISVGQLITNPDVSQETRQSFSQLKDEFSSINKLTAHSKGVGWISSKGILEDTKRRLGWIVNDINSDISFANEARKKGPELMKKIPGIIQKAEKKLAQGEQSPRAAEYLQQAKSQYAKIQAQTSGMTMIDWVIFYAMLKNVTSNVRSAEDYQASWNSPPTTRSSSSSSYGFGSRSGFGGGGGFRSGGGSSGSW